nr:hypothetical protein HmN_001011500 [Hymenolepis microstoma]
MLVAVSDSVEGLSWSIYMTKDILNQASVGHINNQDRALGQTKPSSVRLDLIILHQVASSSNRTNPGLSPPEKTRGASPFGNRTVTTN